MRGVNNSGLVMRVPAQIIGLCLAVLVGFQSYLATTTRRLSDLKDISACLAMEMMVAVLFLIGAGFVLTFPRISCVIFALAGVLGLLVGIIGIGSGDMFLWGGMAFFLAMISYFDKPSPMDDTEMDDNAMKKSK